MTCLPCSQPDSTRVGFVTKPDFHQLIALIFVTASALRRLCLCRLEAGLCLYGNDLTPDTTPVEAALTWLISKRRREARDFPGADVILSQIKDGPVKKRVGLVSDSGPPARHGTAVLDDNGNEIGAVTSGCPSPSLGKNIAMAYVPGAQSKNGTKVNLKIREKIYGAVVTKMPFVASNYYTKPK